MHSYLKYASAVSAGTDQNKFKNFAVQQKQAFTIVFQGLQHMQTLNPFEATKYIKHFSNVYQMFLSMNRTRKTNFHPTPCLANQITSVRQNTHFTTFLYQNLLQSNMNLKYLQEVYFFGITTIANLERNPFFQKKKLTNLDSRKTLIFSFSIIKNLQKVTLFLQICISSCTCLYNIRTSYLPLQQI